MVTKLPLALTTLSIATLLGSPMITAWSTPEKTPATAAMNPPSPSEAVVPGANFFVNLSKATVPSVVNLSVTAKRPVAARPGPGGPGPWGAPGHFGSDPFREFFEQQQPREQRGTALGSGFIIDANGLLLTNHHVVDGADEVEIQLTESEEEKPIKGKVIGSDPDLDVALVKFDPPHKLTALPLGDSDALQVGEFVMAVGNPYGQGHSVSHGIVSAKGRALPGVPLASYLQTDAPINPGNSGGPLLNLKGEVVGINNAIDARAQGISFAIPINYVKKILAQLKDSGKVSRGYLGATVAPLTPEIAEKLGEKKELKAALVTDIVIGGPAARAGIRPYDLITSIGGDEIRGPNELIQKVTATPAGSKVAVSLIRGGRPLKLEVRVDSRPAPEMISQR